eukprot:GO256147.1.p2 GENE.GO256147.1~~GO256147.1.p2  ORF type:complete len:105 (+),score=19.23 GO256147.1:80-394(+)
MLAKTLLSLAALLLLSAHVSASSCVATWGQCGGKNHHGPTCCQNAPAAYCKSYGAFYSQCTPFCDGGKPCYRGGHCINNHNKKDSVGRIICPAGYTCSTPQWCV